MAKINKIEANYKGNASYKNCKHCRHFSGRYCKIVKGTIAANGTCDYWRNK